MEYAYPELQIARLMFASVAAMLCLRPWLHSQVVRGY